MNLSEGIDRFNDGNFFEAHEAWEKEWRNAGDSREKHFLQGMIMIAAALYHYLKKESAGTAKLLDKGLELLTANRDADIEIERDDFLRATNSLREEFRAGRSLSLADFPKITQG
jgi:predicted metal-dependent hydrolase